MIKFSKITWLAILLAVFIIATGFFAFQWWQVKGELGRQIEENEKLMGQRDELKREIDELQKEIEELKAAEEKAIDETAAWKTYRNERFGFEIDYPTLGWGFKSNALRAVLCRALPSGPEKDKENFCILISIEHLYPRCYDKPWEEIFSGKLTKLPGEPVKVGNCILEHIYGGEFEREILTKSGIKGYKGKKIRLISLTCHSRVTVYFPLKGEVKRPERERRYRPLLNLGYFDCPIDFDFGKEEIETFDQVVSTFRFIEK